MPPEPPAPPRTVGYVGAVTLVVANMVGTGVFTTLGLQAEAVPSPVALLALWVVGGLVALAGALSYGELAAALPRSGGEYTYLSYIYHPSLGLAAALVSLTVGFAAPIALTAMALGLYAATFLPVAPAVTATAAVGLVTLFHALDPRVGQRFHVATTVLKLALIAVFLTAGLVVAPEPPPALGGLEELWQGFTTTGFAVSLIYVAYAYSGWNAATYLASEVRHPERVLPRSLAHGTILVTGIYVLLNYVFLRTVPAAELPGAVEVGALAGRGIFGPTGASLMSAMLCLLLLSTISAMVWTGPRVLQAAARDLPRLAWLAPLTRGGAPLRAILVQQGLALAFVATGTFEGVLTYAGFTLGLMALLTVVGVLVLRRTEPDLPRPYRAWGYPLTPAAFLAATGASLAFAAIERPGVAVAALATVGIALGLASRRRRPRGPLGEPRSVP